MSQENVEVARRLWKQLTEGAAAGQSTPLPDFGWDPDVEYIEDPRWPGAGVYRGAEAIQARFAEYLDVLGSTEMRVMELLDAGDAVISIFQTGGKSARTGLPFEHEWAYVWTFRSGRVIEWRAYLNKREALKAVGLSE
jgi:ketosteroid isomerase-like protein